MTTKVSSYQDLPQLAQAAIDAGDFMLAVDILVAVGHRLPDDLLLWAGDQAQKSCPRGYHVRIEAYQGHSRVVVTKDGHKLPQEEG